MKILFVGNENRKGLAARFYNTDLMLQRGFVRNGHAVFSFSDRDELQLARTFGIFSWNAGDKINDRFLDVVRHYVPDVIIIGHANLLANDTLEKARAINPQLRIGQFSMDAVYAPNNKKYLQSRRGLIDATFITSGGPAIGIFGSKDAPAYFMPNITDNSLDTGRAFERPRDRLLYDVVYFAHATRGARDDLQRIQVAVDLQNNHPRLRYDYAGFNGKKGTRGQEFLNGFAQSAMGLSISRQIIDGEKSSPETRYLYSSDRIARIFGNGSLALIQNGHALEKIYEPEVDAVYFNDAKDLTQKVEELLQDDTKRQKIAQSGWQKSHEKFNEQKVAEYVLRTTLGEECPPESFAWPTTGFYS